MENKEQRRSSDIDWFSMIVPLLGVIAVCIWIFLSPRQSEIIIQKVRSFFNICNRGTWNVCMYNVCCIF